MEQWLDSLSEDWVSQPRSQHSSSVLKDTRLDDSSKESQTRIPKPTSHGSSTAARSVRSKPERPSISGSVKSQTNALKARTPSQVNASHTRTPNGPIKPHFAQRSPANGNSIRSAKSTKHSTPLGTVQQKASPAKSQTAHATPEWKRRLVNGKDGPGEGKDLLSSPKPVGLQGVFKPPTINGKSPPKGVGKRRTVQDQNELPNANTAETSSSKSPRHKAQEATNLSLEAPLAEKTSSPSCEQIGKRHSWITDGQNGSVNDSGHSQSDNFSPVYISKRDTTDGGFDYAVIDTSLHRLQSNMEQMQVEHQKRSSSQASERDRPRSAMSTTGRIDSAANREITSQSLPEDLSVGTDAFAINEGFVNTRRGGYSEDGSFQDKPLSPPSSSILARAQTPRDTPVAKLAQGNPDQLEAKAKGKTASPQTPPPQKQAVQSSPERPRSSGSPLKLFDKYDTFTNDRLLRRMSKFEQTLAQDTGSNDDGVGNHRASNSDPKIEDHSRYAPSSQAASRLSSFGEGELDDFIFSDPSQPGPVLPELPRLPLQDVKQESIVRRPSNGRKGPSAGRGRPERSHMPSSARFQAEIDQRNESDNAGQGSQKSSIQYTMNGKRLQQSPAKDPSPKRRRTIHSSEERRMAPNTADLQDNSSKPVVGRKRKDAIYDKEQQAADPSILAVRQIRRPRNPTPNHASSSARKSPSTKIKDSQLPSSARKWHETTPKIDPPTQIVAGALATVALNAAQDMTCGSRKASVATADFFNEAQQIMRLIRADKRPQSSHPSADTPDIGQQTIYEESVFPESTRDDFSRPPSREGRLNANRRDPPRVDARVASHLRKFQDKDDLGLALSSSLKSLKLSHSRSASDPSIIHNQLEDIGDVFENDPPNARIIDAQAQSQSGNHGPGNNSRRGSQRSNGSTKHSFPTGSSGSSRNRMIIAPENVAHLLSDQIAGMVFDRNRQMWVKRKGSGSTEEPNVPELTSDDSDEDFFGDIPDLSVDEMEELRLIKNGISTGNDALSPSNAVEQIDYAAAAHSPQSYQDNGRSNADHRPRTADEKSIAPVEDSSARSRYSHLASSGHVPSTRATSWGDDYWPQKTQPAQAPSLSDVEENVDQASIEEVEHEISILEGRVAEPPNHQADRRRQARVVTVAFSSPLVDQMHSPDLRESWESANQSYSDGTPSSQPRQRASSTSRRTSMGGPRKVSRYSTFRRMSLGEQSRPMSRVDEGDEMSLVKYSGDRNGTLDLAISTPLPLTRSLMIPATNSSSLGFQLSPLPDFTMHQSDRPVDVELGTVARRSDSRSLAMTGDKLSLTAQDLVKHLTDLEPYEPYWEFVRSIDLQDRGLTSLHMLDEFCAQIGELNVANNHISDLNGIPQGVRLLNIANNCLSDLSAWHSLQHMQYLDVSGNELSSLQGLFRSLHLRALKAEHNDIESLSGLENMDGLLSLRLRGNRLRSVSFEDYDLKRLADLDLSCNNIRQLEGLDKLSAVTTLNLSENQLSEFTLSAPLSYLEDLNLANNILSSVDLAHAPRLNRLNLDRNRIRTVENIKSVPHIHHLSWREQNTSTPLNYDPLHEIHNLYLSGNTLPTFAPTTPFLNLRTLELASCGLKSLSPNFGKTCPNLRALNMNFNTLNDIRPLSGIARLGRLYVAGNRLSRLRRTLAVLAQLGPSLCEVDLRGNLLTMGFYSPTPPTTSNDVNRDEASKGEQGKQLAIVPEGGRQAVSPTDEEVRDAIAEGGRKYYLPALDHEDQRYMQRLDEDMKLRRKVYEMMLAKACQGLKRVDGRDVDWGAGTEGDETWETLRRLRVLRDKEA